MEGETSKIKKLASVERLNLNMSDPMNANLSSIFIVFIMFVAITCCCFIFRILGLLILLPISF